MLMQWMLLFTGCSSPTLQPTKLPPNFEFTDPSITSIQWECQKEQGIWSFSIETEGWTSNGQIWLTQGGESTEKHKIFSAEAAADGSHDRLELELEIAADWREAAPGESTRWQCYEESSLSFLGLVFHPKTLENIDCRYWGAENWSEIMSSPSCAHPLE